jgi:ribosomal protein S18 acetylase RimI-like enzyme
MTTRFRPFQNRYRDGVVQLWKDCGLVFPQNDPLKDILRKQKVRPDLFLVALQGKKVVGTVMGGYEGHRGWINYLAVDPTRQRSGIGRALMMAVEKKLKRAGCPKVNLQVRQNNLKVQAFYEKIGYHRDLVVSYGKRLVQDGSKGPLGPTFRSKKR